MFMNDTKYSWMSQNSFECYEILLNLTFACECYETLMNAKVAMKW